MNNINMRTRILLLLLISGLLSHAFVPSAVPFASSIHNARKPSSSLFVFERMSEDCIASIVTAQSKTAKYNLEKLEIPCLLYGVANHPETAALQRTLRQYRITVRRLETTIASLYVSTDTDTGWLSGFRSKSQDEDRPFDTEVKQILQRASRIADQMKNEVVSSHHVFLAMLDYRESAEDQVSTATTNSTAWNVLSGLNVLDDHITALDICESLLENLQDTTSKLELELATGGGSAKTPTLAEVGTDLTELAKDQLLDPVFGRDAEIRSCIRTLIRRRKNNVCLIGDAGVGKTAIAEGVAQILVDDERCPTPLQNTRLISIELSSLVAGTKYRGEFEERLQAVLEEVTDPKAPNTILFLDEIHTLVGAGSAEGGMDAANMLKPALARGNVQIIGATTIAEYRQHIEKDAALERRLQPVFVKEPSVPQTQQILQAVVKNYETHHQVSYTPEALQAAAELSERYINDRFLPDKALDLLDEAGATVQLALLDDPESSNLVTAQTVAEVISEWSGIPIGKLETKEMERLQQLEGDLGNRVKGQTRAVRGVARAIRRARSGLRDQKRPVASFMFCGPTGTGKTELCKTLAETYYGSEKDMIRIDMSEYMEKHTVSRLTGPPPGYIGYESGGQLTEAVRRRPHSVVLLDEIEKAHPDVLNILLQIMEDGILTDGKGRTVNFKNAVLVMTSNVGSKRILNICRNGASETLNGGGSPMVASPPTATSTEPQPMQPEEILQRMQNNPAATSLLMKAAEDPDVMDAIRTAMNGSPNDLRLAAQNNPVIAKFLQDVWSALGDEDAPSAPVAAPAPTSPLKSGLDALRGSFKDTLAQWDDKATSSFSSGLADVLETSSGDHSLYPELIEVVKEELENAMKPELLNRIDEIVVFSPLSRFDLSNIANRNINLIVARAQHEYGMTVDVADSLVQRILEDGAANADQFGARPLRRAAQRYVEDCISDAIIQGFLVRDSTASLSLSSQSTSGKDRVRVTSDGQSIEIEVEDASGGVGTTSSTPRPINGGTGQDVERVLDTETSQ